MPNKQLPAYLHHSHIVPTALTQFLDETTEMVGLQRRGTTGDGEASMKRESRGKLRGYQQVWKPAESQH